MKELNAWEDSKEKVKKIIEKIHEGMLGKAKMMRKNLKYKLYH